MPARCANNSPAKCGDAAAGCLTRDIIVSGQRPAASHTAEGSLWPIRNSWNRATESDFAGRLAWWRGQWRDHLVPKANIVVAEALEQMVGFVTVEPGTHYLDQLVVAPEFWGIGVATKLINEAKRISPRGLNLDVNTDNARAIAFYEKEDFVIVGEGFNAFSGRPVHHMSWRP
jgi:putative acetyltransferase